MYSCDAAPAAPGDSSTRHTTPPIKVGAVVSGDEGEADHSIARENVGGGVGCRMLV